MACASGKSLMQFNCRPHSQWCSCNQICIFIATVSASPSITTGTFARAKRRSSAPLAIADNKGGEVNELKSTVEALKMEVSQLKELIRELRGEVNASAKVPHKPGGEHANNIPRETPWNVVARRGKRNSGSRPPPKDSHAQAKSVHNPHHTTHQSQKNHMPKSRIPVKGARKIWGTLRHTTTLAVQNTLKALTKCCNNGLTIKRKFKATHGDRNRVTKWWFVLRGEEQLLEQLQEEWPAVSVQTSWKLEPVLSYGSISDVPGASAAEQQRECGERSAANFGTEHNDGVHRTVENNDRTHSAVENNGGEATAVESGSPKVVELQNSSASSIFFPVFC